MLVFISNNQPVPMPYVDAQGNQYPPNMEALWTPDELAAIGIKSVPALATATPLDFEQFLALFTPSEQDAIASSPDPEVKLFDLKAAGAPHIDLTDARVIGGINYLAGLGLIQPSRVAEILSGAVPSQG